MRDRIYQNDAMSNAKRETHQIIARHDFADGGYEFMGPLFVGSESECIEEVKKMTHVPAYPGPRQVTASHAAVVPLAPEPPTETE
jgi:hypothetical protein